MNSSSDPYATAPAGSTAGGGAFLVFLLLYVALLVTLIVAQWRMFEKAGRPGWGVLVPIYNVYLMVKMAGRPGWWTLLMFIPFVNIVVWLLVCLDIAKAFGKSTVFGVLALWVFGIVGVLVLGFGKSQYSAPVVAAGVEPAAPSQPTAPAV